MITSDRIHRLGGFLIRVGLAGGLGLFLMLGLMAAPSWAELVLMIPGVVAVALVLFAEGRLPFWSIPVSVLSVSATISAVVVVGGVNLVQSVAESGALLVLLVWTVRRWDDVQGKLGTGLLLAAVVLVPLRAGLREAFLAAEILTVMALMLCLALGVYLRSVDVKRRRAIAEIRQGERLDLARDLHDFVAHHVTGIVVQAQAARYLPDDDPARFRESFAQIEQAGLEALTSMRKLVAVLRNADAGGGVRPLGDLGQLAALVERFNVADCHAVLRVAAELEPDGLPPEVTATVYRVVQEALTNVRKHSPEATTVTVSIGRVDGWLETTIRDDGRQAGRTRLGAIGGGYGLVGLSERVQAIGGRLAAGVRPEGGWEVVARMPMTVSNPASTG